MEKKEKEINIVTEVNTIRTNLFCYRITENIIKNNSKKVIQYENSDKIILPYKMLENISNTNTYVHYRISKENSSLEIYVGIGEFSAPDDICYVPSWMIDFLDISEAEKILLESVHLPNAKKIKAKIPQAIKNYKPVLEYALKHHTALFMGKVIRLTIFEKHFDIIITELEPDYAVSILNCDPIISIEK